MTGLIIDAEYNTQTTYSGVLAMVMAGLNLGAMTYAIFANSFATNVVKTTQIHSW